MRTKTVFPTREVPHIWAHQSQAHGRNSRGNVFFDGATIYSYGRHYPMGRLVRSPQRFALINSSGYSNSTARHTSHTWRAVSDLRVIKVPHIPHSEERDDYHARENIEYLAQSAVESMAKAARARTNRAWHMDKAAEFASDAAYLAEAFGVKGIEIPAISEEEAQRAKATLAAQARAANAARAAELAERARVYREKLAAQLGIPVSEVPESRHYLRINPANPAEVCTTGGATVPRAHVEAAWKRLGRLYARGTWDKIPPIRFGHYTLSGIDADGTLRVGCHEFSRAEVERFARVLTA